MVRQNAPLSKTSFFRSKKEGITLWCLGRSTNRGLTFRWSILLACWLGLQWLWLLLTRGFSWAAEEGGRGWYVGMFYLLKWENQSRLKLERNLEIQFWVRLMNDSSFEFSDGASLVDSEMSSWDVKGSIVYVFGLSSCFLGVVLAFSSNV